MKENKGPNPWFGFITGGGTYKEGKFEEDADMVQAVLPRARLRQGADRPAGAEDPRGLQGRQVALGPAADSGHRRAALQDRRGRLRRQHRRQDRRAAPALQGREGRLVQREEDPEGLREGARGLRQRRLLRVHRRAGYSFPNDPKPAGRRGRAGPTPRPVLRRRLRPASARTRCVKASTEPVVNITMRLEEGKQVLRQPHHLPGQHDDARQRHPARDPAVRGRRVQHRGAEVQRPAPESARLLQAARGRGDRRPEDAERRGSRSTSG